MRFSNRVLGTCLVLAAAPLAACGGAEPGDADESSGAAVLELSTVPTGAQCLQVVGSGGVSFNVTAALTAGASSASVSLGRLPLGTGTINASVYDVACSALTGATPTWIADQLTATFRVGVITTLNLNLRANNPVLANANFVGNISSISAGYFMSTLVMADGTVRTTGNAYPLNSSNVFVKQSALSGVLAFANKASSNGHTCARTATQVLCWGGNDSGQLGTGVMSTYVTSPVAVAGLPNSTLLAVGGHHTCALSNSAMYCLGSNTSGQLGNSSMVASSATPVLVSLTSGIDQISAGLDYTCANTAGGVACWGYNGFGQLGDNTTVNRNAPVYPPGVEGTVSLSAGNSHTCAVRADGTVRCWGYNAFGQLGDGTTTQRLVPTPVSGITDALQVAVGWSHTCVRRANGTVSCFGYGKDGEMGDGTAQTRLTPTPVPGLSNVISIAAGVNQNCALLDDQRLYCWGSDSVGEAGDGIPGNNYKVAAASVQ